MGVVSYVLGGGPSQEYPYPVPNGAPVDTVPYEGGPNRAYATPRFAPSGYGNPAYSVKQGVPGIGETPDPERLGEFPVIDYRGDVSRLPEFYARKDADNARRTSRFRYAAPERPTTPGIGLAMRFAPNPGLVPPPMERVTEALSPAPNQFIRPFGNGMGGTPKANARRLNGWHFSMADHRRTFDVMGMQPRKHWRAIQSRQPAPWSEYMVDVPAEVEPRQAILEQPAGDYPYSGVASYTL